MKATSTRKAVKTTHGGVDLVIKVDILHRMASHVTGYHSDMSIAELKTLIKNRYPNSRMPVL